MANEEEAVTAAEWLQRLFTEPLASKLERIARGRYGALTDSKALFEDARQELGLSLGALAADPERADELLSPAFVTQSYRNRLVDAVRKQFGRRDPPEWLRRSFGEFGKHLFALYCLFGKSVREVVAEVSADADFDQQAEVTVGLLDEMERRRACDGGPRHLGSLDDPDFGGPLPSSEPTPEQLAEDGVGERLRAVLLYRAPIDELPDALRTRLQRAAEQTGLPWRLSDQEAFNMSAWSAGLADKTIAGILGVSVAQVRYQRRALLKRVKLLLEAAGIDPAELKT